MAWIGSAPRQFGTKENSLAFRASSQKCPQPETKKAKGNKLRERRTKMLAREYCTDHSFHTKLCYKGKERKGELHASTRSGIVHMETTTLEIQ